ncbi:MAG: hypothetical protein SCM96_12590 [Acidobacteriota bacterium]|nr:hypothetical protein [Acidobacteriota bacterium]
MRKMFFIGLLLISVNLCFSWEVKLIKTISIDEQALFVAGFFVVMEDGNLLFPDIRDKNNQIKVFNEEGKLIKAWGKMGPGPDEFGGLGFLDYQSPYLAVADAGKHRIHVFENIKNDEFIKISDFLTWEINDHIKIYKKNVLINGYIVSPKGEGHVLFMRDFGGKKTKYILPREKRFGAMSAREYERTKEAVSGISSIAFIDIYEDTAFYVSDVRLGIAKINLRSKTIDFIGKEPKNFRALAMNKKTREMLLNPQDGVDIIGDILTKHSFVSGIFADKDFVGVLYVNREKNIDGVLYFAPHIQIYDHSGNLLHEQPLPQFYSEERFTPLYYQKDKRRLYLCSIIHGLDATKYVIYQFSIDP